MFTNQLMDTGEVSLHVVSGPPSGPPIVLLHGVARRWQDFSTLLPFLIWGLQVHALDFRGHGSSARCPGRYRVLDYTRDVLVVLRELMTDPVVIYGHSLGALVAMAVAAEEPKKVRGVVLEDPPGAAFLRDLGRSSYYDLFSGMHTLAGPAHSVKELTRQLADLRIRTDRDGPVRLGDIRDATSLRFSARCLQDLDPDTLTPLLEGDWMQGYEQEAMGDRVNCPALLLRGDETCGGMLPRRDADLLVERMPDCTRIDFPGAGHLIHWLQAEKLARYVGEFLASL